VPRQLWLIMLTSNRTESINIGPALNYIRFEQLQHLARMSAGGERPMALVSNYLALSVRNYGSCCISGRAPPSTHRMYVTVSARRMMLLLLLMMMIMIICLRITCTASVDDELYTSRWTKYDPHTHADMKQYCPIIIAHATAAKDGFS